MNAAALLDVAAFVGTAAATAALVAGFFRILIRRAR